jgi:hypothetical protein
MGYIVRDIDEAVRHWADVIGVGPFFVVNATFSAYSYRGLASFPKLKVALSYSGAMQVELIEQVNDAPSAYKAWLDKNGPGLHHVGMMMDEFETQTNQFEEDGAKVLMEGQTAAPDGKGVRFKFYDTAIHNGCIVEAIDSTNIDRAAFQFIQDAAANWDGKDATQSTIGRSVTASRG